jgi:hypothetical protein
VTVHINGTPFQTLTLALSLGRWTFETLPLETTLAVGTLTFGTLTLETTLAVGTLTFGMLVDPLTFGMLVGTLTFGMLVDPLTFGMLVGTLTFGMLVGTFTPPALALSAPTTTAQRAIETLTSFVALILSLVGLEVAVLVKCCQRFALLGEGSSPC